MQQQRQRLICAGHHDDDVGGGDGHGSRPCGRRTGRGRQRHVHDVPDAAEERRVCAFAVFALVLLLSLRGQGVEQAEALSDMQLQSEERDEIVCALSGELKECAQRLGSRVLCGLCAVCTYTVTENGAADERRSARSQRMMKILMSQPNLIKEMRERVDLESYLCTFQDPFPFHSVCVMFRFVWFIPSPLSLDQDSGHVFALMLNIFHWTKAASFTRNMWKAAKILDSQIRIM